MGMTNNTIENGDTVRLRMSNILGIVTEARSNVGAQAVKVLWEDHPTRQSWHAMSGIELISKS